MSKLVEAIMEYMETKEFIICFILTLFLLSLSFVLHTRLSTTEIVCKWETYTETYTVHISYYGFPCEMVGILTPIGAMENYYVIASKEGLIRILWGGLLANFALYFSLSFFVIYLFKRSTVKVV
ncbi:MAG: hypothetical protein QXH91_01075 [Candidatus Bathyarchaeia archaeon]